MSRQRGRCQHQLDESPPPIANPSLINTHSSNNALISLTPGISHMPLPLSPSAPSFTNTPRHSPATFLTPSILSVPSLSTFPTTPWNVCTFSHLAGSGSERMLVTSDVAPRKHATRIQEPTSPRWSEV